MNRHIHPSPGSNVNAVASVPEALSAGDCIAVVAPAGPMLAERMEQALRPLREAGFCLKIRDDLHRGQGTYLAGEDSIRLEELTDALYDSEVKAIVAVRGGYGVMRLLRELDARLERDGSPHPKRIAGFSDITTLHLWAQSRLGWASLHSPMPFNFSQPIGPTAPCSAMEQSARGLVEALTCVRPCGVVGQGLISVSKGVVRGPLTGGNLSLFEATYGTPHVASLKGAILFLEDVGEATYRLDRMLMSLELRGLDREVVGVVVGGFTGCGGSPDEVASFVAERVARWGVPVARGLGAGHRFPNQTLWMGVEHVLDATRGELLVLGT